MDHAWLDSLSEDWVSQPASDASAERLPSRADVAASRAQPRNQTLCQDKTVKSTLSSARDVSSVVLSERSTNDLNVSLQRRLSDRTRKTKVPASDEVSQSGLFSSVLRNNVQRRASSRRQSETPEWKRRLVHGKMSYGEQRDLFSSAAVGLQDMFKPPVSGHGAVDRSETTLPSSPPLNPRIAIDADLERFIASQDDDEPNVCLIGTPSPGPRNHTHEMKYTFNIGGPSPSVTDDSVTSAGLAASLAWRGRKTVPEDRKSSGQSVTRNEDLSPILIGKRSGQDGRVNFAPIEVPVEQLKQKLERLRVDQLLQSSQEDKKSLSDTHQAGPETTEDCIGDGGFINMQRGGRSGDGSFYQRALSSELGVDSSEILPEESLQASTPKQFPTIRTQTSIPCASLRLSPAPCLPRAPFPSPDKRQVEQGTTESRSTGSPLKLFGPYDTFTNQTLLRRISQFEEASRSPSRVSSSHVEHQDADHGSRPPPPGRTRSVSRFGDGDLEGFEFAADVSNEDSQTHVNKDFASQMALSPVTPMQPPEDVSEVVGRRRQMGPAHGASRVNGLDATGLSLNLSNGVISSADTPKRDGDPEGKRTRTSPAKGPTPKRRRTLHRSDVAFRRHAVDSAHHQMQSMMNAYEQEQDNNAGLANSEPLAPRSVASSGSQAISPGMTDDSVLDISQNGKEAPKDRNIIAERPRSIRTQDFVDQAAQIMAMIRSQVMPGLASVEESEAENLGVSPRHSLSDSCPESTNEPLSRPPSREGKPLPRIPQRQEDPELIRRLKQYQERSDGAEVMASSIHSINLASTGNNQRSRESSRPIQVCGDIITDLPNVRISMSEAPDSGLPTGPPKEFPTNSSERSTSRTFPTTSSRGSESRRTIMPESVSHLIPDKVGSMYLDKHNNIWVKRKDAHPVPAAEAPSMGESEDDPFASIPDLSVDITKELQNLRLATSQRLSVTHDAELQLSPESPHNAWTRQQDGGCFKVSQESPHAAPTARKQLAVRRGIALGSPVSQGGVDRGSNAASTGMGDRTGDSHSTTKRRNLTISFSSPIASIIYDVAAEDIDSLQDDDAESCRIGAVKPAFRNVPQPPSRGIMHRPPSGRGPDFVPRPVSRIDERDEESTEEIQPADDRQVSIVGESSIVNRKPADGRHPSLSFIINHATPNNRGVVPFQSADESAIIGQNVGRLSLSPLSEFTVNKSDPSFGFEVSYVMGQRRMATGDGSKRVMSMTIRELVDKLGEVEPYEPYWEDMTRLDLHGKQLASLHMLGEFCGRVVTLDASENKLGHLDGIPATVRHLKASHNLLTELTSWNHLMNLQYMDISGNEIKSLSALKKLVHLRSIQADDNQLTSLDGVEGLDGLLSLRARNNVIESVDFAGSTLSRLSDLDLGGNRIGSLVRLEKLPALARLNVRGNQLRTLTLGSRLEALRQLDVSDNQLCQLDLGHMPGVRSVQADRNRIHQVSGCGRARRLDSLSLREQGGDQRLSLDFLRQAYEVRKLFLSGNYLRTFEPTVDFLNLQLLELANCGLQKLPERMGQMMPNLRTFNINLNAVTDLWPLQFLPRLKKLLAAGNRLADATAATQLLTDFPHLRQLDLRDNPMTLGLYCPTTADGGRGQGNEGFELMDANAERDVLFASRLDEATRLRRRLHQVVLVANCRRLRKLDGLTVRRDEVLARDGLLEALVREGVVADDEARERVTM